MFKCYQCYQLREHKKLPLADICVTVERWVIWWKACLLLNSGCSKYLKGGPMASWTHSEAFTAVKPERLLETDDCAVTKPPTLSLLKQRSYHFSGWLTRNCLNREWHCFSTIVKARVSRAARLYFRLSSEYFHLCRYCIVTFHAAFAASPRVTVTHDEAEIETSKHPVILQNKAPVCHKYYSQITVC